MLQSIEDVGLAASPATSEITVGPDRAVGRNALPVFRTIGHSAATGRRLRSIRAVILLEGSVGASPFGQAVGRSLLELPVTEHRSVLDVWASELSELAQALGPDRVPCRIVVARNGRPPRLRPADREAGITVEHDPAELRGTGGLLRDLSDEYAPDDSLLVVSAAQILNRPLSVLAAEAAAEGGDVTVVTNVDGSPSGVTLVACRALRCLPSIGFSDFKEQGLPLIAKEHRVTVLSCTRPSGLSIRTPRDYARALRTYHLAAAGDGAGPAHRPFAEQWQSAVTIVERGAAVHPSARLHDAVVLAGGEVAAGAVVVRSIVCAGGRVARNAQVLDRCVSAAQ